MISLQDRINQLEDDYSKLKTASSYTANYLIYDGNYDSTPSNRKRIEWIHKALLLPAVKEIVLKAACELAKDNLEHEKKGMEKFLEGGA